MPNLAPADLGLTRTSNENRKTATVGSGKTSIHVLVAEAREAAAAAARGDDDAGTKVLTILGEILKRDAQHRDAITIARNLASQGSEAGPALDLLSGAFAKVREPELRYELGLFLGEKARSVEASITYYQAANTARPSGRRALRGLVNAYRQLGDDKAAAAATEKLLELFEPADPSAIDLRMGIANFLGSSPETLPRAIEQAKVVLRARPDDARAIMLMSDLLERSDDKVEAGRILDRLVTRERNRERLHDLYLRKAKLLSDSPAHRGEALQAVERAAALNPGNRDTITLLVEQLSRAGQTARVSTYLPPIRSALQANVARGAVSLRDFRLLAKVAAPKNPDLAKMSELLMHALEPGATTSSRPKVRLPTAQGLRRFLENVDVRHATYAEGEPPSLHNLLQAIDGAVARMPRDFPSIGSSDQSPVPAEASAERLSDHGRKLAEVAGVRAPRLASSETHNTVVLIQDPICTIRLGKNLWAQGDAEAWRGLMALAIARAAAGASRARALPPPDLDLVIAASFEVVEVFNPTTADPDPRRLREVVQNLRIVLPRRQRKTVETACQALASHAFDAGKTARSTTQTDLRLGALISADYSGALAAACLLDGVVGGTLKQRVARSRLARDLLSYLISDEFVNALKLLKAP